MEFCLSESFQYRAFPAPCMAWTLMYTLRRIQTPQTYILFIYMLSDTSSRYLRTNQDNSRHHQTPTDTKRHQQTSPDTQKGRSRMCGGLCWYGMAFAGVCWCLMVSVSVLCCLKMWRGCLRSVSECCLWTCVRFRCVWGCIWVFWPCMVQQMPYIGKAPKGKIPCTWHFWNIKIPKPPYISSLKMVGFVHFSNFLIPSEKYYNSQSFWITLYSINN